MKKRLSLKELQVKSFVTDTDQNFAATIKGGDLDTITGYTVLGKRSCDTLCKLS